jgi:hypothetical protein
MDLACDRERISIKTGKPRGLSSIEAKPTASDHLTHAMAVVSPLTTALDRRVLIGRWATRASKSRNHRTAANAGLWRQAVRRHKGLQGSRRGGHTSLFNVRSKLCHECSQPSLSTSSRTCHERGIQDDPQNAVIPLWNQPTTLVEGSTGAVNLCVRLRETMGRRDRQVAAKHKNMEIFKSARGKRYGEILRPRADCGIRRGNTREATNAKA